MSPMPSAQTVADSWAKGMGAATEKLKAGVNAVTEAPTAKAANRVQAQVDGVIRAMQTGKTEAALRRVTLEEWKRAMLDKGVGRVASGATQSKPKFQAFMQEFLPWLQEGQRQLESSPRGDLEQNLNRMVLNARHNAAFRRSR